MIQDNDESDFEAEDSDVEDDFDGEMESDEVLEVTEMGWKKRKHTKNWMFRNDDHSKRFMETCMDIHGYPTYIHTSMIDDANLWDVYFHMYDVCLMCFHCIAFT